MLWLQEKYFRLMSGMLEQVTEVRSRPLSVNFRCVYCGDSKTKKRKKRAYLLERDQKIFYYCHNCGASRHFDEFLREQSPALHDQYKLENLKIRGTRFKSKQVDEPDFKTEMHFKRKSLKLHPSLDTLQTHHPVVDYVKSRKIPEKFFGSLHSCDSVTEITNQLEQFKHLNFKDPALVIPFYDGDSNFSHITFRSIDKSAGWRYYTLEVDDKLPKIWGLKHIDWTQPVYVFEGPIDAMCFPNSLALSGSVGFSAIEMIHQNINKPEDLCFVYDNEIFSNTQINRQVKKRISEGYQVVLYDSKFPGKDLNEVLLQDQSQASKIISYIKSRRFAGLAARLEMSRLSKPMYR